jgi:hypothetical protein
MKTLAAVAVSVLVLQATAYDDPPKNDAAAAVGRWDLTVRDGDREYPSWLEVRKSGRNALVGSYVGEFGSARPIANVAFKDGRYHFVVPPQWERRKDDVALSFKLVNDGLVGLSTNDRGRPISIIGRRAPTLKREAAPQWAEPVELFNGKDLTGWKPRSKNVKNGWVAKDGLLVNETPGNDLITERAFTDFKLHAEFRYPKGSNSGIYLRGRYEFQIEDDFGEDPDSHKVGGIYGFLTPSLNAAGKPGEWQTVDLELVGRVLSVVLNGERIIDRQTIPGITGGALDSREGEPGPVMIQGDHGPVEFRKLTITPVR